MCFFADTLLLWRFFVVALLFLTASYSSAQSLLPLRPGMAVVTCASFGGPISGPDFVMGVIDVRNPDPAIVGQNWSPPMYHGPQDSWTAQNLGQVFGVCLDDEGNIYVTATTSYGLPAIFTPAVGPAGWGGVYKVDGQTGAISIFAQLPNSGPALGNICYDRDHDQFFVTNFEDGKLYRLSKSGTIESTFDPYQPDDGTDGFAPLGERPWGINIYGGRVYYGVWWSDYSGLPTRGNEVRSIGLDEKGEFKGDDRNEIQVPILGGFGAVAALSDITFSSDGRMVIAERSMQLDLRPTAHTSRIMEYNGIPGNWQFKQIFQIGNLGNHTNSAGGVDFGYGGYDAATGTSVGCDEALWGTGDALRFPGFNPDGLLDFVYGIARMPGSGNTEGDVGLTSYYIDLDGNVSNQAKSLIGDMEIFRGPCFPPDTATFVCGQDTVQLHATSGLRYHWTPSDGLSCSDCPDPVATPDSTTIYTVEITDALGATTRQKITVSATPRPQFTVSVGAVEAGGEDGETVPIDNYIVVPIKITPEPDPLGATRFIVMVTYPKESLALKNEGTSFLANLVKGTQIEGWKSTILEAYPGFFRVEFRAPTAGEYLRDTGAILRIGFQQLLSDFRTASPISATIDFPDQECLTVSSIPDTIPYQICGLSNRLMEFVAHKYFLNITPNVITAQANITFSIAFEGMVRIEVFDMTGAKITELIHRNLRAGEYYLSWDQQLPSGVYYVRMSCGDWSDWERIIIRK